MEARTVSTGEDGTELVILVKFILFATLRKNWEVCLSESGDGAIFSLLSPHLEEVKSGNAFHHLRRHHLYQNCHKCRFLLFSVLCDFIIQIIMYKKMYRYLKFYSDQCRLFLHVCFPLVHV